MSALHVHPLRTVESAALSSIAAGTTRQVLCRIRETDVNLAIWVRKLPADTAEFCAVLAARPDPLALDVTAHAGSALRARLAAGFTTAQSDATALWLLGDMADLAADFAALAECPVIRVRLTKVVDDGCAAFHVDTLPLRLLCTYAGKGTQWADSADVCRAELGVRGRSAAEANASIVPDATRIRTMSTGAVAVMKGRLWHGSKQMGLVHRSHPVCCGEHARLRLVIDAVPDAEVSLS
jgi:hypothetical protein